MNIILYILALIYAVLWGIGLTVALVIWYAEQEFCDACKMLHITQWLCGRC